MASSNSLFPEGNSVNRPSILMQSYPSRVLDRRREMDRGGDRILALQVCICRLSVVLGAKMSPYLVDKLDLGPSPGVRLCSQ